MSWGLSRSTTSLLYKSTFIPTILYNCTVWASAINKKRVVGYLKSAQRPFALAIGRLFKSTSLDAALILANLTPLHLEVVKSVAKRAILPLAELLPHSSRRVAGEIPVNIITSVPPANTSLHTHRKRLLNLEIATKWNSAWSSASSGAQTRLFFPSVESALILDSSLTSFFLCSILSGHCILNKFLFKLKRSPSPLCSCLSGEEEDVSHILFYCSKYDSHRDALKLCATDLELAWPIPLHSFPRHKTLWSVMIKFLVATKRFQS